MKCFIESKSNFFSEIKTYNLTVVFVLRYPYEKRNQQIRSFKQIEVEIFQFFFYPSAIFDPFYRLKKKLFSYIYIRDIRHIL